MPTLSIIIPVYNSEKYLKQCLDSILAQASDDFEILLIDDGSTDFSLGNCAMSMLVDIIIFMYFMRKIEG